LPFYKVFVKDLVAEKLEKSIDDHWTFRFDNKTTLIRMVWIQGVITEVLDENIIRFQDDHVSNHNVTVTNCKAARISLANSSLAIGGYCQILAEITQVSTAKTLLKAVKIVPISDQVLKDVWPLEVKESLKFC